MAGSKGLVRLLKLVQGLRCKIGSRIEDYRVELGLVDRIRKELGLQAECRTVIARATVLEYQPAGDGIATVEPNARHVRIYPHADAHLVADGYRGQCIFLAA